MTNGGAEREISDLSELLRRYEIEYHIEGRPSVSDAEYDRLFDRLLFLESQFPSLILPNSPTARVGSDLNNDLPEARHTIPVLSLDKTYAASETLSWLLKTAKQAETSVSFVVEEKIDGVSIVLYYERGLLTRAVTRGNGSVGNDVTANVRTIRTVPLRLSRQVDIAVRGEIYIPLDSFQTLNKTMETPYANPRNLAAGSIRRIKSAEVSPIPLTMFAYEGFFAGAENHLQVLSDLSELGFRVNSNIGFFSDTGETAEADMAVLLSGNYSAIEEYIAGYDQIRKKLTYEIDGLVIKVNEISQRDILGYTGHHPRWEIAYKFESPEGKTKVNSIDVQVGRTGRITPVARVMPVQIGGSTVSNVTLHNQDYINILELGVGDTVAISKRGDVIPAVERVVEKNEEGNTTWRIPQSCPSCDTELVLRGAHHFCANRECPDQVKGRLFYFVGRSQMDIDNLGSETIEVLLREGLVKNIQDIYTCDYDLLEELTGFGEKKINLIKEGVKKSLSQPFHRVLPSLGLPELGPKVTELLLDAGYRDIESLYAMVDQEDSQVVTEIAGIGEKTAAIIFRELLDPEVRKTISALRQRGLNFRETEESQERLPRLFENQVWCVTGSFEHFKPRSLATDEVKKRGGQITSQISGQTTHLLAGIGAGSKLVRAGELGIPVVTESDFIDLIGNKDE